MKLSVLLAAFMLAGCNHPVQRFIPTSTITFALDTKTGQECITYPKSIKLVEGDTAKFPYCIDLYKSY